MPLIHRSLSTRLFHRISLLLLVLGCMLLLAEQDHALAQADEVERICPAQPLQFDTPPDAGGIILTAFDRTAIWVYDVASGRRYPLPDTAPCTGNCHLSPDSRWLAYFNPSTNAYNKMRLDGSGRTLLTAGAGDVSWWSPDTLLVWTPGNRAYLRPEASDERRYLLRPGLVSVQPNGGFGLILTVENGVAGQSVVNLETPSVSLSLGEARSYYNSAAWSPDGHWLAYVAPQLDAHGFVEGANLFGVALPELSPPLAWTHFDGTSGVLRIGGLKPDGLSWSPDGNRLAFWVVRLDNTASIMTLDVASGQLASYCGATTTAHTPNPPRLVWSPDGRYLSFALDFPDDTYGSLLLALDPASGVFYAVSDGVYPALGTPEVTAWGLLPG